MTSGIYKRRKGIGVGIFGKYIRTPETKQKMREAKLRNPTKYWLGKKLPISMIEKIKQTKIKNDKKGNKDYFKTHKFLGKNNKLWKGDKVGYWALHSWVARNLGKPTICEYCGKKGLKAHKIHWANKSGKYKRILTDWLRLCCSCHRIYDFGKT